MANQSPKPALPGPLTVPQSFPTTPQVGKINILYDSNQHTLYHKLSPYGSDTFLGIKTKQPFFYKYPDDNLSSMEKYASREFPFTRAITDVERVTRFLISGPGILWLGKQFLMQTGNAFNETRIYNPTSPPVGAALPLTLWAVRPQRNIDTSNLLGSLLGSLGTTISSIFTSAPPSPPAGTAGASALPTPSMYNGKGLIRAGTANAAKANLEKSWAPPSTAGLGLGGFLSSTIKGLFGNFIPQRQSGVSKRSDEITYGLMLGSYGGELGPLSYQGVKHFFSGVQQFWFAGTTGEIRSNGEIPLNEWMLLYVDENGTPVLKPPSMVSIQGLTSRVGFDVPSTSGPVKYGDSVGNAIPDDDWEKSNMLIQHAMYVDEGRRYPTKGTDRSRPSVIATNKALNAVIADIQQSGIYSTTLRDSSVLMSGNQIKQGYDRIAAMKNAKDTEEQYLYSVLNEYRQVRVLENQHSSDIKERSLKMGSSRQFDGLNTLNVLDNTREIVDSRLVDWKVWEPYKDDVIAFYFYDVVNSKYIPFRCTVKGLQETDTANWEEMTFIGRADKLYSYTGFSRSLTFTFTVHVGSVVELAPTWQRINYLLSLVKPSSYTRKEGMGTINSGLYTRFMVPPMVMLTIGDLYKNHPIILASAGISIPPECAWETLNQYNSNEWSYLINYIKAPNLGKKYGQLPFTADISINAFVLEKERPVVGAAHFGHSPHDETYTKDSYIRDPVDGQLPSEVHKALVVYNEQKSIAVQGPVQSYDVQSATVNSPAEPSPPAPTPAPTPQVRGTIVGGTPDAYGNIPTNAVFVPTRP